MSWQRTACRLAVLPLILSGCGQPAPRLFPVVGLVTFDGQPLPRGSVSLRGAGAEQQWDQPTGIVAADGRYEIFTNGQPGAPPGDYRVVVFATEAASTNGKAHPGLPQSLIPKRYNDPQTTPLRLRVAPDAAATSHNLELVSRER